MEDNELRNAIEHEELKTSVKVILNQIETMQLIQGNQLKSIQIDVKDTLEQTKKTNGRVTAIENDMLIVKVLRKHKWLFAFLILGLMKLYEAVPIEKVLTKLLNFIF